MRLSASAGLVIAIGLLGLPSLAEAADPASNMPSNTVRPQPVLREVVKGMPKGESQEVSVFTASFQPGDKTMFHTHRFPVTVYILEGAFTLELEGREPVTVKAGEALVEPPGVQMTGYNRSATEPLRLVIFYTGDPGTPFLDLVH
ncbi:MAG: cupin domain-containing protein [Acidobacteriota bacterium]